MNGLTASTPLDERRKNVAVVATYSLAAFLSVLAVIPMYLIYFVVQPMPAGLVAKQIVFGTIGTIVMGIAAAWINKRDVAVPA